MLTINKTVRMWGVADRLISLMMSLLAMNVKADVGSVRSMLDRNCLTVIIIIYHIVALSQLVQITSELNLQFIDAVFQSEFQLVVFRSHYQDMDSFSVLE
jgi:hypothetical protein